MYRFLLVTVVLSSWICIGCDSPQPKQSTSQLPVEATKTSSDPAPNEAVPAVKPKTTEPKTTEKQPASSATPAEPVVDSESKTNNDSAAKEDLKNATPAPATNLRAGKTDGVEKISFDDLNCGMQADVQFRPWMLTDRVKELDGKRVRISGYMNPSDKQKGITEFILLRNTECKFGPSGQADHLIQVKLEKGVTASYSIAPIEVEGTLVVNPFTGPDGNTWSIFDMTGQAVRPVRR